MIQSWKDIVGIILILVFILYNIFANLIPVLRKKEKEIIKEKIWRFLGSFHIFCLLTTILAFGGFGIFTLLEVPVLSALLSLLFWFIFAIVCLGLICLVIWGIVKGLIEIINKIKSRQNKEGEK